MAKATVFWDSDSDPKNPGYSVECDGEVLPLDAKNADDAAREAAAVLGLPLGDVLVEEDLSPTPAGGITKPAMHPTRTQSVE